VTADIAARLPELDRISDYARYYAARTPSAEAMRIDDRCWTYRQLADEVDAIARALIASGVKKGDRVATLLPPHPDYFLIFLATSSIGAIWMGLNPRYRIDEYRHVLGDSEPCLLFARTRIDGRDYSSEIETLAAETASIRDVVVLSGNPPVRGSTSFEEFIERGASVAGQALAGVRGRVRPDDTALIVYTSGSTGTPKGAMLPHRGLVKCSRIQQRYWGCDPLRVLNYAPINHVGCVGDISSFCLVGGGCMVFLERYDPSSLLEIIERHRITWFLAVPTVLHMILALPEFDERDLSSLQKVCWSGAAAPPALVEAIAARFPVVSNGYGMTETVGSVTFCSTGDGIETLCTTIGFPVPEYEVRIGRADGSTADPGEEGEILVRGDFIMNGYWRRPEATAETIDADGWLHTADIGVALPGGAIRLAGRMKDMFVSGGYNVYPREIENTIESHEDVLHAAVIPVDDDVFGEVGHAFVETQDGSTVSTEQLQAYCRERMANYKIPKRFVIVDEMPMLPIGKIDKNALRDIACGTIANSATA